MTFYHNPKGKNLEQTKLNQVLDILIGSKDEIFDHERADDFETIN
jgi:hypothetical protein